MKVITLWQPWASLWVEGFKQNETRSKQSTYIGTYLVHAAVAPNKIGKEFWKKLMNDHSDFAYTVKSDLGTNYEDLPFGKIIGSVFHIASHKINPESSFCEELTKREISLGDYSENRYCWQGKRNCSWDKKEHIPYKNGQGFYLSYKGKQNLLPSAYQPLFSNPAKYKECCVLYNSISHEETNTRKITETEYLVYAAEMKPLKLSKKIIYHKIKKEAEKTFYFTSTQQFNSQSEALASKGLISLEL